MGQTSRQRGLEKPLKLLAAYFDSAEAGEMPRNELSVKQGEAPIF
jgi:hypothetical protein